MCIFVKWIICFVNTAMFSCVFCQCHRRSSWSSHAKSMHLYHHQDTISWKIHILMNPIVVVLRLDCTEVQLTRANQGLTLGHEKSQFLVKKNQEGRRLTSTLSTPAIASSILLDCSPRSCVEVLRFINLNQN